MKKRYYLILLFVTLLLVLSSCRIGPGRVPIVTHGWLFETEVDGAIQYFFVNIPNAVEIGYVVSYRGEEDIVWDEDTIKERTHLNSITPGLQAVPEELKRMVEEKMVACYEAEVLSNEPPEIIDPSNPTQNEEDTLTLNFPCAENCRIMEYIPSFLGNNLHAWYAISDCDNNVTGRLFVQLKKDGGTPFFEPGRPCSICASGFSPEKAKLFVESKEESKQILQDYFNKNSVSGVIKEGYFTQYNV